MRPYLETAVEYVRLHHPRILFLSLGETDDWAHSNNYGEYLLSAHRVDDYLRQLWTLLQSMPEYRNNTALIFTTDHGRGSDSVSWQSHGQKLPDSKYMFIGMMGAGVPGSGLQVNAPDVTQSQIAATIARLLGQNWNSVEPQAGKPLPLAASPAH